MSALGAISRAVPDALMARMLPAGRSFDPAMPLATVSLPDAARMRLLIGPENSAGQGEAWARAVTEHVPWAVAESFVVARDDAFGHAAGLVVPAPVFAWSRRWQAAHREAIAARVTHLMIESGRPILAGGARGDVDRDVRWLRDRGIRVAFVWHGSDARDPDRHAAQHPHSPYADASWGAVAALRASSAANRALAASRGLPSLVSTPDLLDDVPGATWLPLVVDAAAWRTRVPPLAHGGRLRVVHAPSRAVIKGTALIEPVLDELVAQGVIDYRRIEAVAHSEMPALYREADVVLDQFRLGSYGVAAVEALAAGRIVIGDVDDRVRDRVRAATGLELPMISARPEELADLLRRIAGDPGEALALAEGGPRFAADVHDGRRAAAVIADVLAVDSVSGGTG